MLPHLVVVPGLMCDAAVWQPLRPRLDALATCQVVDHGDADDLVEMARRLLDAAPPRFALAGHSMGGRVALEVLRLVPARVAGLALLDTGYQARPRGAAGDDEARKRHELLEIARRQGVGAMARRWALEMVHPERRSDVELIDSIVGMFERKSADTFARQVRALLQRPDATDVLGQVAVPTLVLCGREDGWAPVAQHEAMALRLRGHASLRVVEQAGHMCTMERPAAVADAIGHWLAATCGRHRS